MTISDTSSYKVTKETLEFARKTAINSNDENTRKRIYEALICLRTLAEYFISEGYSTDFADSLFRIIPVNEELECNDLHVNGSCIDVRTVVNEKYVLIPKSYYKYDVLPDLFAVAKYNSEDNTVKLLGCIDPLQADKERQNEKYYITDVSKLVPPSKIEDTVKLVKEIKISDQNHDLYASYFIDYCDGVLSEDNKKELFNHLFECKDCREKFSDYYDCELIVKHSSEYPQILQDQMLNIVGAAGVDNEKYKDFEEVTLEIDKEPDKYAEDMETDGSDVSDDPLKVLYGEKTVNTNIFDNIKQKTAIPDESHKKPRSLLDSVLADFSKSSVDNIQKEKDSAAKRMAENINKMRQLEEKNLAFKNYFKEAVSSGKDKETDVIENIHSFGSDTENNNKTEDVQLLLEELTPLTEQANTDNEKNLSDASVDKGANSVQDKNTVARVDDEDNDDIVFITDDSDINIPFTEKSDEEKTDLQNVSVGSEKNADTDINDNHEITSVGKVEEINENNPVHFDAEDIDIVDENDDKEIVNENKADEEQNNKVALFDGEKSQAGKDDIENEENNSDSAEELNNVDEDEYLSDNEDDDLLLIGEDDDGINFEGDEIEMGTDDDSLFLDSSSDDSQNSEENQKSDIDDLLNSDLINIDDSDFELSQGNNVKTKGEHPVELQTGELYPEIGDVIDNLYDTHKKKNMENSGDGENVIHEEDDDEEIIIIDDNNQPIDNFDNSYNAEHNNNNDSNEEDEIMVINDDDNYDYNTSFVRPASVSDLNTRFMSENIANNNKTDNSDDEVIIIDNDEDNRLSENLSFNSSEEQVNDTPIPEQPKYEVEENIETGNEDEELSVDDAANHADIDSEFTSDDVREQNDEPIQNVDDYVSDKDAEKIDGTQSEEYDADAETELDVDEDSEQEEEYESDEEYSEDESEDEGVDDNKEKIKKAAIIGLIALIGLGAVGGGLFMYSNKAKNEQASYVAETNPVNAPANNEENMTENSFEGENSQGINLPAEGENSQLAAQMPPQDRVTVPERELSGESSQSRHENKAEQAQSKDMNQVLTDAFSANPASLKISKTSWAVAPYLASDEEFKVFLKTSGSVIQSRIKRNISSVKDNTYSETTKVRIEVNEGVVENISISKSSGSKQIDEIVLQSVKDYMNNTQLPKLSETTVGAIKKANGNNSYKMIYSVNF